MNSDHLGSSKGTAENLAEAEGAALDYLVAKALGYAEVELSEFTRAGEKRLRCEVVLPGEDGQEYWTEYLPSTEWETGGPIIEREGIEISCMGAEHGWQAAVNPDATAEWLIPWHDGPTPLVAAMRAFVASKNPT